jgi:Ca2+-binding RTX toxin-like protein
MVRKLTVFGSIVLLLPAAAATASTSHEGWPKINGDLIMHKDDESSAIVATKRNRHNELLGGHGNDNIRAGRVGDVLWGDYKPSGQPDSQVDRIRGGAGKDFIYASHGTNFIHGGGGKDQIHAHFGRGAIWCASGKATVFLSHKSRKRYTLHGCTRISYRTVGF